MVRGDWGARIVARFGFGERTASLAADRGGGAAKAGRRREEGAENGSFRMGGPKYLHLSLALAAILLCQSAPLLAYIGPGAGISFLGSLFTMLLVGLVAIASVLFWPVRYLWRRWRKPPVVVNGNGESNQDSSDS